MQAPKRIPDDLSRLLLAIGNDERRLRACVSLLDLILSNPSRRKEIDTHPLSGT